MKIIGAAAALLAFATIAHAGEMEGKIKSVDADKKMVVLEDGTSMMASDKVMLGDMHLMAGDQVTVMTDANNMITDIKKK